MPRVGAVDSEPQMGIRYKDESEISVHALLSYS